MPKSCVAFNCTNRYKKESGISFHQFPFSNALLLKKWVVALRREGFHPAEQSSICSNHFLEDCFYKNHKKRTLKPDAVPSIFNFSPHLQKLSKIDADEACSLASENKTDDDLAFLNSILPEGYESVITEFNKTGKDTEFDCGIRFAIFQKEDALKWLKAFEAKSLTTWKVDRTFKEHTPKIVFKKEYHCQHNTKPRACVTPHEKHTNCPSKLTITLKQLMKRSADKFIKTHPCQVHIRFCHNHELDTSAALKHRVPTEAVKEVFEELFRKNHSPSTALQTYKFNLRLMHGDDYYKLASDGAVCPKQKWVYDLYYKVFKKEYGDPDGEEMLSAMEKYIEEYNEECGEICAASQVLPSEVQSFSIEKDAEDLKQMFEDLQEKLKNNPAVFADPIKKFVNNYKKCKTESSLVSALHTFGKYNGMPIIKKGKNLQGERKIGVLQTAIARRKIKIGGRRVSDSGQPTKTTYTVEHGYGKRRAEKNSFSLETDKESKAPFLITLHK